ncbi:hypothetical protein FCULG_00008759 [Fusarium culmorum]|uniref:Uncharacterized protein n=1 Tax=Fusarium culmorum TaxID=5516 RepID=A0A2T4H437_FUSCU|nr:hypothetical protein FCULG_00008759 [Fusarium culmorum]
MATGSNTTAGQPDWTGLDFVAGLDLDLNALPHDSTSTELCPELSMDNFNDAIDPTLEYNGSFATPKLPVQAEQTFPTYGANPQFVSPRNLASTPAQSQLLYQSPSRRLLPPKQSQQAGQAQPRLSATPQQYGPLSQYMQPYAPIANGSYQPQSHYPDVGINGHQGALSFPPNPLAYGQVVGYPAHAQALKPRRTKPALKSRWMDEEEEKKKEEESDECPEDPTNKSSKNASRLKSRAAKAKAARRKRKIQQSVDPSSLPYPPFEQLLAWNTKDGCEIAYLPAGQLDEEVLFTAKELRDYLQQCPRKPKIWLQNTPSKCKGRHIDADVKCRYSECPAKNGTILHGWHRVAFDEFPEMTSEGTKDPFKMAGVMHLWCFEQCIDPLEPIEKEVLFPDEREFPKEKSNRMAITRDDYKDVIDEAIKPWIKERRRVGVIQPPYSKHEDTLSWALCNFHIKKQNRARERMREQRNQNRLDDEKKTVELIMGDLSEYHRRLELSKARKRAILLMQQNTLYEQQHNLLYGPIVARPMFKPEPPVREEITVYVPECAAQDEEEIPPLNPDLISDAEIAAFIKECAASAEVADRPLTPQSLGAGVQRAPHSPVEIQDSIAIPDSPAVQESSPVSTDSLFGSPTKTQEIIAIADSITVQEGSLTESVSSPGSRKRSQTEEDAAAPEVKKRRQTPSPTLRSPKGSSPLRRSSRVSLGSRSSPRINNGSAKKVSM